MHANACTSGRARRAAPPAYATCCLGPAARPAFAAAAARLVRQALSLTRLWPAAALAATAAAAAAAAATATCDAAAGGRVVVVVVVVPVAMAAMLQAVYQ